jgi:DNA-binding transcriptional LysR family regulator
MALTHRHLEVFRAVMQTGQVTRAAERLHTSQPTISRELARMEQVTGLQLFERVKGRLHPTPRALALMQEVEAAWVGLERISATAASLRHFAQGRLQLACLPALAHALLPDALARFAAREPAASVSLATLESPQLEAALTEQRHDLGLVERREAPPGCQLDTLLVADEVCVLPEGDPLAALERLSPADFEGRPFVSLAPTDPYRVQIDAVFAQQGVARQLRVDTPAAATVCALVRQGLGLGIVNPLTALEMAGPGLVVRPFSVSIPFHVALVRPSWRPENPLRARLAQALGEAAEALRARLARA